MERGNKKKMSSQTSSHRSKTRRSKVSPGDSADLIGNDIEMAATYDKKNNTNKVLARVRAAVKNKVKANNPINLITNLKQKSRRWRDYATTRRKIKLSGNNEGGQDCADRRKAGGEGLTPELGPESQAKDYVDGTQLSSSQREIRKIHNRNLIQYFANFGKIQDQDACLNLEYIESELLNGANINCTDKYGQSVLHEAARAWDVDVARFLVEECKADINQADHKGRTPLHVAAAVDYPEMVSYLIDSEADKEARTKGEEQTPVHFAARNDACLSLKALIKKGCLYKEVRDYKGRTPLHVAAELDRSDTAKMLLELEDPAPAGVMDNSGQAAIVWMITKMPPVAKIALDQFHTTDRANRKQFYYLNWLEPRKADDDRPVFPQTAMQVIINYKQIDLITHPVIARLIDLKWRSFGKLHAIVSIVLNLMFIISWTVLGISVDYNERHTYILPDQWWRILVFVIALGLTVWQIKEELSEFISSKKSYTAWQKWRKKEIERDLEYTHPRWPEEEQYLRQEIESLDSIGPQYFNDFWNIFDWICYALLLVCIITHLVDVFNHTNFIARLHIRIMAVTVILIWLRLMKNARAFSLLGPFIVIISHMVGDVIKFLFLYLEFFIPFACAFHMIFGGKKVPEQYQGLPGAENNTATVAGMEDFGLLLYTLFRLTLVDEYDYDGLKSIDSTMAHLLLVSWFALSAVLMLNLFIALMSDTFQRVYDRSNANAVMQKAITILSIEDSLSSKRKRKFREFIHSQCSPEKDFYDDDITDIDSDDLKKVTVQIKEDLDDLREKFDQQLLLEKRRRDHDMTDFGGSDDDNEEDDDSDHKRKKSPLSVRRFEHEMDQLQDAVSDIMEQQTQLAEKVRRDMSQIKSLLQQVAMTAITGQGQARSMEPVPQSGTKLPALSPKVTPGKRQKDTSGLTVEIQGPGQMVDLSSSQVVARRPPMGRVGQVEMPLTHRSATMDFGEPSVYGAPVVVSRQQSAVSSTRPSHTEDEWETIERTRRRDLKQLRQKLSQQQQLATVHSTHERSRSVTTDEESVRGVSSRGDDKESVHTDVTVVQPGETSDNMGRIKSASQGSTIA